VVNYYRIRNGVKEEVGSFTHDTKVLLDVGVSAHQKMKEMPQIYGFNKCSEAGIDVFAPAIFTGGCNFRCPYCMNSNLATGLSEKRVNLEEVKQYVLDDKSEWFMISGGEPTCVDTKELINLLEEIKSWGCKVGISTNGSKPEVLSEILPLLNYVAMDFKSSDGDILKGIGAENGTLDIINSKCLLMENKLTRYDFDYEIRTTLYPKYINEDSIRVLGSVMRKDDVWVLQQFRHAKNMIDTKCYNVKPYTREEVESLVKIAKKYTDNVKVRYV